MTVSDGRGGSDSTTLRIDAGNTPPSPSVQSPATSKLFRVGEIITLTGSASDPEDGTLPASALSWTVLLHHNTHTHPFLGPVSGNNVTFNAPAPEDLAAAANSYLEIQLTATDSKGAKTTVSQRLDARRVDLTFETQPYGWRLNVGELIFNAPRTVTSWDGYQVRVTAPTQIDGGGSVWTHSSWWDSGAASHVVTTPASPATFKAWFRFATGALFNDNFETGNLSRWHWSTGIVAQTTHRYAGTFGARATTTGSPAYAGFQLASPRTEVFYQLRFNVLSRGPNSPVTLARVRTAAGTPLVGLGVSEAGTMSYRNDVTGLTKYSSAVVSSGWHRAVLRVRVNGAASEVEIWLDGARLTALTQTESLGTAPIQRVQLGDHWSGRTYDVAFDNIAVD
ncbi:MAG: hypothetical protein ABR583_05315 [Gaiellaceae bacterium]